MELIPEEQTVEDRQYYSNPDRAERAEEATWRVLGLLYARRKLIIGVTLAVAVATLIISLLLPHWYRGTARLLLPEGGGLSSALLGNLPSAASALLGGGSGDYARYLAILTSRSVSEAVVDEFDLTEVYGTAGAQASIEDAVKVLAGNVEFTIDREYEFLSISVLDKDPDRAAAMANFYVSKLNEVNARLTSQSASNYRRFLEKRYYEARSDMDSVFAESQTFQEEYGIFDLPTQTQGFFAQLAEMRSETLRLQIQYEVMRDELGPENPRVKTYRSLVSAANRKYENALKGAEQLLPVAKDKVPEIARTYAGLELERTIQAAILEVVGPLYEQARLQEEREAEAVQIVDVATPPVRKAKPKRSVICIAGTLSAFLIVVTYVLASAWWRRNSGRFARRLDHAAHEAGTS